MPINKIFWFVSFVTVVFLGLRVVGYPVTEAIIAMIIIDIIVLKVLGEGKAHTHSMKAMHDMNSKLGGIHTVLLDMSNFMRHSRKGEDTTPTPSENSAHNIVTLGAIEKTLNTHKEELRTEIKDDIDKIAEKIIEVENRIYDMRKGFSAAIAAFDDRMRSLESEPEEEEAPDDYVEVR